MGLQRPFQYNDDVVWRIIYLLTKEAFNLQFGLVPKTAKRQENVIWTDTGRPGAIVHPLNAWEEEDGTVVIRTPHAENLVIDLDTEDINTFDMVEYRLDPST